MKRRPSCKTGLSAGRVKKEMLAKPKTLVFRVSDRSTADPRTLIRAARFYASERVGWRGRIWRIWSTDWFRNPQLEAERLFSFLDELRSTLFLKERFTKKSRMTMKTPRCRGSTTFQWRVRGQSKLFSKPLTTSWT